MLFMLFGERLGIMLIMLLFPGQEINYAYYAKSIILESLVIIVVFVERWTRHLSFLRDYLS